MHQNSGFSVVKLKACPRNSHVEFDATPRDGQGVGDLLDTRSARMTMRTKSETKARMISENDVQSDKDLSEWCIMTYIVRNLNSTSAATVLLQDFHTRPIV